MKLKGIAIILMFGLAIGSLMGCSNGENNISNNAVKEVVVVKDSNKEEKFMKYLNPRFGYSLSYPDNFKITKESDNGDGVELSFEKARIIVYGSNNVLQETTKSLYTDELKEIPKKDVMESYIEKDIYSIMWKEGNFIKYKKSTVGEESINSFEVIYPLSKEKEFRDMVSKISESFKTPNVDKMG